MDSNQRTPKRSDLQSDAFNHSATPPLITDLKNQQAIASVYVNYLRDCQPVIC